MIKLYIKLIIKLRYSINKIHPNKKQKNFSYMTLVEILVIRTIEVILSYEKSHLY